MVESKRKKYKKEKLLLELLKKVIRQAKRINVEKIEKEMVI